MAKTIEFKELDIMSVGKICAALAAVVGILAGLLLASILPFAGVFGTIPMMGWMMGGVSAIGLTAVILLPIAYAVAGFVYGVVIAFLYNLIAARIGGIKIKI